MGPRSAILADDHPGRAPVLTAMESDLKTTTLGRSGLHVSRIAFGTWQLGGDWGRFDEDAADLAPIVLTPPRKRVAA